MMKHILVILLLFGCASEKYAPPSLKYDVVMYRDPVNKAIFIDYKYENGILAYKKMIKENRINSDPRWSCFKNGTGKSVNYIEMLPETIKYFRSLHMDEAKIISYEKQDVIVNDKYIRKYRESTKDVLKLISKKCIIDDAYVTSEVYIDK